MKKTILAVFLGFLIWGCSRSKTNTSENNDPGVPDTDVVSKESCREMAQLDLEDPVYLDVDGGDIIRGHPELVIQGDGD